MRGPYLAITVGLLMASGRNATAQDASEVTSLEVEAHRVEQSPFIHSKMRVPFGEAIALRVVVNAGGAVESADCVGGLEELCSNAKSIEFKQKFRPFEKDGVLTRVTLSDNVYVLPMERWADVKVPFPEIVDLSSLKIRLKRSDCYGFCPTYSVEIRGDGEVEFVGEEFVLITGRHAGTISKEAIDGLLSEFRKADYFSLDSNYYYDVSDNPTYITSIEFDGRSKTVADYAGLSAGMPEVVGQLESAIDQAAGTEKWIKENSRTGAALLAEHWDFRANTEANHALFANVVAHGSEDLIRLFLAQGASPIGITKDGRSALVSAAAEGNLRLVKDF